MPVGTFTSRVVAEQVSHITRSSPVTVDMMNDLEAIIELEPESVVVHTAQALQATGAWNGRLAEITCKVMLCHSLMHVIHEWKIMRNQLQQLEAESCQFKHEQQLSQEQLVEPLQRFSLEVKHIEEVKKEVSQQKITPTTPEVNPVNITPEPLEGAIAMETTVNTPGGKRFPNPHPLCTFLVD